MTRPRPLSRAPCEETAVRPAAGAAAGGAGPGLLAIACVLILTGFPLPAAAAQDGQETPSAPGNIPLQLEDCREVRRLDAMSYWFWDGYFGVADELDLAGERQGRLGVDEAVCFRISVAALDDPVARTRGYRQAVDRLIQWIDDLPDTTDPESSEERARRALRRLTGQRLETGERWAAWWSRNRDYVWSAETPGRLEVDETAREAGAPIDDDALVLGPEEYWFYEGRGWISRRESRGEYLLGEVSIPPHGYAFRARTAELEDRGAKLHGYRRALESLIVDGLMVSERSESDARDIMALARALTSQEFDSPDAWIDWWRHQRDRLQLSADGQRLVSP